MAHNLGKSFENKFYENMSKLPGVSINRIYDTMTMGRRGISNISDYIVYRFPEIFYMEIKSVHGNTFPLGNLTQYEKLIKKKGIVGTRAGVVIWFIDHDTVIWVPIESFERIKNENYKSINITKLDLQEYDITRIPSKKLRTFMDSDYSVLFRDVKWYMDNYFNKNKEEV